MFLIIIFLIFLNHNNNHATSYNHIWRQPRTNLLVYIVLSFIYKNLDMINSQWVGE